MTSLGQLFEQGQSCWIDNLTRDMIETGSLARRVTQEGVRGVTSNPSIFARAIEHGEGYARDIASEALQGDTAQQIYECLTTSDVRAACDVLRPLYDRTLGSDGFASLEISPRLAHDTQASIEEAKRLWARVDRANLLIKIPGTAAGVAAIEELLFEGINVNVTLLFSVGRFEAVADAYLRALERRLRIGRSIDSVSSVASLFVSRIDGLVDQLLGQRVVPGRSAGSPDPQRLMGKAAVANARLAYSSFRRTLASARWKSLAEWGARAQRLLWASTSTKNPHYPDLMYVEPLVGPFTVSTMPEATLAALEDHGRIAGHAVEQGVREAGQVMRDLERLGISLEQVGAQLENEGIGKFIEAYDAVVAKIGERRERILAEAADAPQRSRLQSVASRLRRLVIRMTTEAGSGHPTSCLSCADLVAALFFHEMRWDPTDPVARNADQLVLSKGHAAPVLWAALAEAGAISENPLTLRRIDSTLEGHPTTRNPWVRVATGSLGQGLAAANGIALANRLDRIDARIFCLLGDGECSEGSVWEAAQFAALNGLTALVAIVDVNGLGQSGATPYGRDTSVLARRFAAFGWRTIEVDGHDFADILRALRFAHATGPTAILARTVKGKGVSFLEGADGWHGKALNREQMAQALAQLAEPAGAPQLPARAAGPAPTVPCCGPSKSARIEPQYRPGELVATREAFGAALVKLGREDPAIVALDGDVKNSTGLGRFAASCPDRFFEGFIAEQNMIGVALGLAVSGKIPYVATFACFLTRAYDFIRMAQYSRPPHLILCGSHCGVSIGEDGPSQMGLEDIAMFRGLIESTILYPADAVSAERLTEEAMSRGGIVYLRTTRPKTAVIYPNDEAFPVGGCKVLRTSKRDRLTVVAAGITVHEALAAHETLLQRGVAARIIDAYSIKPLDADTIRTAARETGAVLVVEDHSAGGGLGDAVGEAVGDLAPLCRLAVTELPRSGTGEQLLAHCGISRAAIVEAARKHAIRRSA